MLPGKRRLRESCWASLKTPPLTPPADEAEMPPRASEIAEEVTPVLGWARTTGWEAACCDWFSEFGWLASRVEESPGRVDSSERAPGRVASSAFSSPSWPEGVTARA